MKLSSISSYRFTPNLPENLSRLSELAYNFYWSWRAEIGELFRHIDPELWESTNHNPVRLLLEVSQWKLSRASASNEFVEHYNHCLRLLDNYLHGESWYHQVHDGEQRGRIVFFSMEYGLASCLPLYSGGLGVLSGDYLKAASDLGLPVVGIGLAYRQGYFQQRLDQNGHQTELYPKNEFDNLPMQPVTDADGKRLTIQIPFHNRQLTIGAWLVTVGRIPLYVLDTDLPENNAADRSITHTLYGGDRETRIQQEIVLGFGGIELLRKLGITMSVCHMNEGHSAFVQIARVLHAAEDFKLSWFEALQLVSAGTLFTTHTPVPAGIDEFSAELMDKYFSQVYNQHGITRDDVLGLGSLRPGVPGQPFNMAICALRTSDYTNGVSRLHADVSRRMWTESWPSLPHEEVPIDFVTNGVHHATWVSHDMSKLISRHFNEDWREGPDNKRLWSQIDQAPDHEIWETHNLGKLRLIDFVRSRVALYRQRVSGFIPLEDELNQILDPHALTIGFARRFATYKRATLLLHYPERLLALLKDTERPVQFVFAGKAHPQDVMGKDLIQALIQFARKNGVEHRMLFIENYDMTVASYLVQGVDIWMNNPRRPLEASGTSGMKVLINGGLNFSILDGWWDEGYLPENGWAIGAGLQFGNDEQQDESDARMLFDVLEKQIVPLYYRRNEHGVPEAWMQKVKASMRGLVPRFAARRMVKEYWEDFYVKALERCIMMEMDSAAGARELARWKKHIEGHWHEVKVLKVDTEPAYNLHPGSPVKVRVEVSLGGLLPDDVEVQICYGQVNGPSMDLAGYSRLEHMSDGSSHVYAGDWTAPENGLFGFTVRVVPSHPYLGNPLRMGIVRWAPGAQ
ncbi:MAG: alpha-glucan family phosphorylase [Calditrichaeota bacterium]|nr:alpha-glucan family phosphorylase [Calditrichota bacterium]MCB9366316.1 alpha-glucan family phosphorylase [Calditrichota bacterium]